MTIKDQSHYNPEEQKPEWRETKGFKYQIFRDQVRFLFADQELAISDISLREILKNFEWNRANGYYTGQCIDCHKFDSLVKGYCATCFKKNGMEYDK